MALEAITHLDIPDCYSLLSWFRHQGSPCHSIQAQDRHTSALTAWTQDRMLCCNRASASIHTTPHLQLNMCEWGITINNWHFWKKGPKIFHTFARRGGVVGQTLVWNFPHFFFWRVPLFRSYLSYKLGNFWDLCILGWEIDEIEGLNSNDANCNLLNSLHFWISHNVC